MESMHEIARAAVEQTPPPCRVSPEHAAVIARNADALVALGPEIAAAFYNTLFDHKPTAKVFHEGERPMREKTFLDWWERTAHGPIDDDYWA